MLKTITVKYKNLWVEKFEERYNTENRGRSVKIRNMRNCEAQIDRLIREYKKRTISRDTSNSQYIYSSHNSTWNDSNNYNYARRQEASFTPQVNPQTYGFSTDGSSHRYKEQPQEKGFFGKLWDTVQGWFSSLL